MVQTFLQPVPVGFRAGWGGRRWEGDGGGGLRGVVHGQNETRAADGHVVLGQAELVSQALVKRAPPAAGCGAFGVEGARAGLVGADGDVGVHGAHAGIVQDEVGVVVKLLFILVSGEGRGKTEKGVDIQIWMQIKNNTKVAPLPSYSHTTFNRL